MRFLIVEDDINKRAAICEFVRANFDGATIEEQGSLKGGFREILEQKWDIVLLDMSLPPFDDRRDGRFRPFAGREILQKMKRRRIRTSVIVVTQFQSFGETGEQVSLGVLSEQLAVEFSETYIGFVYYEASHSTWRGELRILIMKSLSGERHVD